ncbi:hypothetical protein TD95_004773 [Thielaviopsis punctulata]|uniref:EDC4-like protein pdc1 beta-propeller domain-containing protein n=1 Tax=Thielaviopsis punctulata TaxID=72032 RepID=A0A0F4ZCX3_9PEZI|nr:hypothetical protein TD95_004773 [Thielaviopsis punctulata]
MDGNLPPAPTPPVGGSGSVNLLNLFKFNEKGPQSVHQLHGPSGLSQQYDSQGDSQQAQQHQQHQQHQQPQQSSPHSPQSSHSQPIETPMFPMAPAAASSTACIMAPAPVAPDPTGVLAAMMRGEVKDHRNGITSPTPPATSAFNASPKPVDRAYLLNLLNRPKPSQQDDQLSQNSQQLNPVDLQQQQQQQQQQHSGAHTPQSTQQQQLLPPSHHDTPESPNSVSRSTMPHSMSPGQQSHSSIPPGYKFDHPAHEQRIPNYGNNSYYGSEPSVPPNATHLYNYPGGPDSINSYGNRDLREDSPAGSASGSRHVEVEHPPDREGHASSATSFQMLKKPQSNSHSPQASVDYVLPESGSMSISSPDHEARQHDQPSNDPFQTPHTHTTESFVSITPINKELDDVDNSTQDLFVNASDEPFAANSLQDLLLSSSTATATTPATVAVAADPDSSAAAQSAMFSSLVEPKPEIMSSPMSPTHQHAVIQQQQHHHHQQQSMLADDQSVVPAQDYAHGESNNVVNDGWNNAIPRSTYPDPSDDDGNAANDGSKSGTDDEPIGAGPTEEAIAENWENADPEEDDAIPEIKEEPLVKVFNFPMQPWISITLSDKTEPRPSFREIAIMEVARLRKEFDQVDRNLYTATSRYMAYAMSKAGGLRVIRQDDGKDAKIFSDTKDRIFNISMSVTGSKDAPLQQEAILGTGISGTVYWTQIWKNDKDLISGESHPEINGFALPPQLAQEGDAPGGILKTRARVSSGHPEFFATGRGKSISIIWPSLIMEGSYFKAGHDRVVDPDLLARACSLKINTGKAGKDFVFSQDDTVIVSLDKSGRIKFWDIRELVATSEDSDPLAPMPANTHMEIKEPLMTLGSTPEGEKAWPTSVMLLDKARPFQKRCALRYMIVGMKQNHTLQLWDLALGKPVQEFNLPHSKESDAVCSVTYHPETGMIVIGHPTRNSVYLAHLSAPKYSFRSISQADYMLRLASGDSTIPQPDSTAVISGVREYSFADRGILRSLDLLTNPASSDEKDQVLFELYAMHSKGATCIFMRQADLGWSKENKVVAGIDAEKAEIIRVDKLKALAPIPSEEVRPSNVPAIRKDGFPQGVEDSSRKVTIAESSKPKNDFKDKDATDGNLTANEKSERKTRKKKNAAQNDAAFNGSNKSARNDVKSGSQKGASGNSQESIEAMVKGMEARLNQNMADLMATSMSEMHLTMDDMMRTRNTEFDKRQIKLLDLVSDVLNDNTQKVLGVMIDKQFHESLVPAIGQATTNAINNQLSNKLSSHVGSVVQKEVQRVAPAAIQQCLHNSLQSPQFIDTLTSKVVGHISGHIQDMQGEFFSSLGHQLAPSFTGMAMQASERAAASVHERYQDEIDKLNAYRMSDRNKIDQLLSMVTRLSDTVSTLTQTNNQFQAEIMKLQQRLARDGRFGTTSHGNSSPHAIDQSPRVSTHNSLMGGSRGQADQQPVQQQVQPMMHHQHVQLGQQPSQMPLQHQQVPIQPQPQHMYKPSQSQLNQQQSSQQQSQQQQLHTLMQQSQQQQSQQQPQPQQHQPQQQQQQQQQPAVMAMQPQQQTSHSMINEYDDDLNKNIAAIQTFVGENKLEAAIVRWLQSGREHEIFARYWCGLNPLMLQDVPSLVQLSVAATVAQNLEPGPLLRAKVAWLDMCVLCLYNNLGTFDDQIKEVTPRIMTMVSAASSQLLNHLGGPHSTDPLASVLNMTVGRARAILEVLPQERQPY